MPMNLGRSFISAIPTGLPAVRMIEVSEPNDSIAALGPPAVAWTRPRSSSTRMLISP